MTMNARVTSSQLGPFGSAPAWGALPNQERQRVPTLCLLGQPTRHLKAPSADLSPPWIDVRSRSRDARAEGRVRRCVEVSVSPLCVLHMSWTPPSPFPSKPAESMRVHRGARAWAPVRPPLGMKALPGAPLGVVLWGCGRMGARLNEWNATVTTQLTWPACCFLDRLCVRPRKSPRAHHVARAIHLQDAARRVALVHAFDECRRDATAWPRRGRG